MRIRIPLLKPISLMKPKKSLTADDGTIEVTREWKDEEQVNVLTVSDSHGRKIMIHVDADDHIVKVRWHRDMGDVVDPRIHYLASLCPCGIPLHLCPNKAAGGKASVGVCGKMEVVAEDPESTAIANAMKYVP